jgi:uncharacterized protein (DUF2062 family)
LVIPLKRGQKSPEHTARGVMIGVGWAMTPTVGIQMPLVFAHWFLSRRLFGWDFSLINGLAWTWLSNVFTLLPIYYLFFLTGQVMLGRLDDLTGYEGFLKLMDGASDVSLGDWEAICGWFEVIIEGWGVSMLVGCVPWAILSGWIAYIWSLAFVRNYRAKRLARKARTRAASSD